MERDLMLSRDLDIFFKKEKSKFPIHCATFGSIIPDVLNDDAYYLRCVREISGLPDIYGAEEIEIEHDNVDFILGQNYPQNLLTDNERKEAYIRTFFDFARKGFWSYDRFHHPHKEPYSDNPSYLLIAHPKQFREAPKLDLKTCHTNNIRLCSSVEQCEA